MEVELRAGRMFDRGVIKSDSASLVPLIKKNVFRNRPALIRQKAMLVVQRYWPGTHDVSRPEPDRMAWGYPFNG